MIALEIFGRLSYVTFLVHVSRGLALEKNVAANRMFPNGCLVVLAKPGTLLLAGVGQARGALRAPRHMSRAWSVACASLCVTLARHGRLLLALTPQASFPCSGVIQFQLCVVFSDFIFKLIKGYCETRVLLAGIEV